MADKYLSEIIYLDFNLPDLAGQNISYNVTDTNTGKLLYKGSVYVTGESQRLYLNDIISTMNDTYKWFRYPQTGQVLNAPFKSNITITFNGDKTYTVDDIVHITKVPYSTTSYSIPTDDIIVPLGTKVIPRIPRRLLAEGGENRIFTMFTFAMNDTVKTLDTHALRLYNGDDSMILNLSAMYIESLPVDNVFKFVFGVDRIVFIGNKLGFEEPNMEYSNCYLGLQAQSRDLSVSTPVARVCNIDDCSADYYVMWINRYGTWQSQPLHSKWEMKEKVTTNSITTVYDETIPCSKMSEYSWQLNTDWLTYDEHDEFESLLTSKYVFLYNTKNSIGEYVTVTDSNWTFKNGVNTKKPFNLTLNLTKSIKQNIVF